MEFHLSATECHLPYGITQCYLPPDTSEHTPPNLILLGEQLPSLLPQFPPRLRSSSLWRWIILSSQQVTNDDADDQGDRDDHVTVWWRHRRTIVLDLLAVTCTISDRFSHGGVITQLPATDARTGAVFVWTTVCRVVLTISAVTTCLWNNKVHGDALSRSALPFYHHIVRKRLPHSPPKKKASYTCQECRTFRTVVGTLLVSVLLNGTSNAIFSRISRNGARYDQGYYDGLIGSRICAFDWHQSRWPWMTLFKFKFKFSRKLALYIEFLGGNNG